MKERGHFVYEEQTFARLPSGEVVLHRCRVCKAPLEFSLRLLSWSHDLTVDLPTHL